MRGSREQRAGERLLLNTRRPGPAVRQTGWTRQNLALADRAKRPLAARCPWKKTRTRCPRSRQNGAISQHPRTRTIPHPALLPSLIPLAPSILLLHTSRPEPAFHHFYLFGGLNCCSASTLCCESPHWPLARIRTRRQDVIDSTPRSPPEAIRTTSTPGNRRNRSKSHISVGSVLAPSRPSDPPSSFECSPRKVERSRLPKQNARVR